MSLDQRQFFPVEPEPHTGHQEQLFVYGRLSPISMSATEQVRSEGGHSIDDGLLVFAAMYREMSHPHRCGVRGAMFVLLAVEKLRLLGSLRSRIHKNRALNHTARSSASKRVPCHLQVSDTAQSWRMWKKIAQPLCKVKQGLPYPWSSVESSWFTKIVCRLAWRQCSPVSC